jgi:hypothetical protein
MVRELRMELHITQPQQLGFGFEETLREQETARLPATLDEAIPYYRRLIEHHHTAMLSADAKTAMAIRDEAYDLARKVNGGNVAIMGHADAPAYVLERATSAPAGTVPLWGQTGEFTITIGNMAVRIEQEGVFGVAAEFHLWPGFAAHAVDYQKPFLSDTGYRSFLGCHMEMVPGITPDLFAREMIQTFVARECKGKLHRIGQSYIERRPVGPPWNTRPPGPSL